MNYFLVFCIGNSGGSWLEAVLNTHPDVKCWEEPRRKLNLDGDIQAGLLSNFEAYAASPGGAVGYIKGFREGVIQYVEERGGRIIQLMRNPIQVIHGKRNRKEKPTAWWGREPRNDEEFFEGLVCQEASRYHKFMAQSHRYPLIKLEVLAASFAMDMRYAQRVLERVTGLDWSYEQMSTASMVAPHYREAGEFGPGLTRDKNLPFDKRADPWPQEILDYWQPWQREIFLREFEDIMLNGGYGWLQPA